MGFFSRKTDVQTEQEEVKKVDLRRELEPLKEISRAVNSQKNKLISAEKETVDGVSQISRSFDVVQDKYTSVLDSVEGLKGEFDNVKDIKIGRASCRERV